MKADLTEYIEIPKDVEVGLNKDILVVKGKKGELNRRFSHSKIKISKEDNKIMISAKKANKKDKAVSNTFRAHIKNMIRGVTDGFKYKLKICFTHFPITVEVKNNVVLIKNLLGEKIPRKAVLLDGVNAKVEGDEIILEGTDIEIVGQSAANIEHACKIKKRDRRVFQDGCYITLKRDKQVK